MRIRLHNFLQVMLEGEHVCLPAVPFSEPGTRAGREYSPLSFISKQLVQGFLELQIVCGNHQVTTILELSISQASHNTFTHNGRYSFCHSFKDFILDSLGYSERRDEDPGL